MPDDRERGSYAPKGRSAGDVIALAILISIPIAAAMVVPALVHVAVHFIIKFW